MYTLSFFLAEVVVTFEEILEESAKYPGLHGSYSVLVRILLRILATSVFKFSTDFVSNLIRISLYLIKTFFANNSLGSFQDILVQNFNQNLKEREQKNLGTVLPDVPTRFVWNRKCRILTQF
jgi:hypothetical protein